MADRLVNESNLGAWLLRSNPTKKWDIARFMEDGHYWIGAWSVAGGYRSDMMAHGQKVILWVTGDGKKLTRGIWGVGYVTGMVEDEPPREPDAYEIDYWIDAEARAAVEHMVPVDIPLLPSAIRAIDIEAAGLDDLEVFRQPQGSNPSWLSKDQLARLEPLLPEWPQPLDPVDEITVSIDNGAGHGDPEHNSIVEAAAMAAVWEYYEASGWTVDDVSLDKVGRDLTCASPDGEVVQVEVKGVTSRSPKVLLTANELRAARERPAWYLAVVTRALSDPNVTEYEAQCVIRAAKPYVYKLDLT
jgi:hypothetical protein